MIRPTPSAHELASETLRMAYEGRVTRTAGALRTLGLPHHRAKYTLQTANLPHLTDLIRLGRVLRGLAHYMDGPALNQAARTAGWGSGPDLSRACKEVTGKPAAYWKSGGASLARVLNRALERLGTEWRPEMAELDAVASSNGPSIDELWECDGRTRPQRQAKLNRTYRTIVAALRANGFRWSNNSNQFTAGPCTQCSTVYERDDLDRTFRCEDCGGHRTPAWLERERELHHQRMKERKAGKRPSVAPVHTFQYDDKGRKIYARRPGVRAF